MASHTVSTKPHAVCVPLQFQSHIIVMLKVAKLLHFRGFHITFVDTEFQHQKILNSRGTDSLKGLPDFQFETIPDGLPTCDINASQDVFAVCDSIANYMGAPFHNLINKLNQASPLSDAPPPVTCIISDAMARYALETAHELGIPGVQLWPMNAAFLMTTLYSQRLLQKGIIPLKDKVELDMPINLIPGMRNIKLKDLPTYFRGEIDPLDKFMIGQLQEISMASGVIINTFEALESEVLQAMKPLLPPIYTLGPLQLLLQGNTNNQLNHVRTSFWKEDEESLKWLDSKRPNSVLYVNFGSLVVLSLEQFMEFAWGIANSGHPFLWVIRPDLVTGESETFLSEFLKVTADRGMISGWCKQEEVLSHTSTGGFLTHSGWNSTMDTICGGVPVISWPWFVEQHLNSRYACDHWGIGVKIDGSVKRNEVEGLVKELMEGEKGKEMKEKALGWKKCATKPGGTSYDNVNKIIELLLPK